MYPCSSRQEIGGEELRESLKAMLYISYMNYSGQGGKLRHMREVSWSSENSQVVERNSIFRKSDLQIE